MGIYAESDAASASAEMDPGDVGFDEVGGAGSIMAARFSRYALPSASIRSRDFEEEEGREGGLPERTPVGSVSSRGGALQGGSGTSV